MASPPRRARWPGALVGDVAAGYSVGMHCGLHCTARAAALLVTAVVGLCACDADVDEDRFDPAACSEFVVPSQYGLRWANANHRISLWETRLAPVDAGACDTDGFAVSFVGGDWTTGTVGADVPTFTASATPVRAVPELAGAARVAAAVEIGPAGEATVDVSVPRAAAGLLGYPHLVAFVDGIRFETDVPQGPDYPDDYDPRLGYTSRGIGAGAAVAAVTDGAVTVRVTARFEQGPSDREDMNRAQLVAHTRAVVDVLLVGSAEPARVGDVDYTLRYERQLIGVDPDHAHASEEQAAVLLQGLAGAPEGVVGFAAFDFRLSPSGECSPRQECPRGERCVDGTCSDEYGPAGFYIREYAVSARILDYAAETGAATVLVDGFASNASTAFAFQALESAFSAEVAWLQLPTGPTEEVSEPFDAGSTTIPFGEP